MIVKVQQLSANKQDNTEYFEGDHIIAVRSGWIMDDQKGLCVKGCDKKKTPWEVNGHIIYRGDEVKNDDPCVLFIIKSGTSTKLIATNCPAFLINNAGKTVDTYRTKDIK